MGRTDEHLLRPTSKTNNMKLFFSLFDYVSRHTYSILDVFVFYIIYEHNWHYNDWQLWVTLVVGLFFSSAAHQFNERLKNLV